ncbi:MAG: hypothetical protein Kow00106_21900 [Anaerolineae bacterium]
MRKVFLFTLTLALLVGLLPTTTQAVADLFTFDSLDYAACTPGEYAIVSFNYYLPGEGYYYHYWTLTNQRTGSFTELTVDLFGGGETVQNYPILPVPDDVQEGDTLVLQVDTIEGFASGPALAPPQGTVLETDTLTWTCGSVAGCDVLINIPSTAVVGAFVSDAPTYWKPGELTSPLVTIPAGNTAWVLGPDSTGQYEKIIWVCDYLWVPANTIGPNYDEVWQGKPLPTEPVE